jgi:hypothetical protein
MNFFQTACYENLCHHLCPPLDDFIIMKIGEQLPILGSEEHQFCFPFHRHMHDVASSITEEFIVLHGFHLSKIPFQQCLYASIRQAEYDWLLIGMCGNKYNNSKHNNNSNRINDNKTFLPYERNESKENMSFVRLLKYCLQGMADHMDLYTYTTTEKVTIDNFNHCETFLRQTISRYMMREILHYLPPQHEDRNVTSILKCTSDKRYSTPYHSPLKLSPQSSPSSSLSLSSSSSHEEKKRNIEEKKRNIEEKKDVGGAIIMNSSPKSSKNVVTEAQLERHAQNWKTNATYKQNVLSKVKVVEQKQRTMRKLPLPTVDLLSFNTLNSTLNSYNSRISNSLNLGSMVDTIDTNVDPTLDSDVSTVIKRKYAV